MAFADVTVALMLFASADRAVRIADHPTPSERPGRVVMAAKSQSKSKRSAPFLRLAYSAPTPDESIAAVVQRLKQLDAALPRRKEQTRVR